MEVLVGHVPQDAHPLDALTPQPWTLGKWKSPDGASHRMSPPGPASHLGTTSVPKEHHLHPWVWSAPCHPPCQDLLSSRCGHQSFPSWPCSINFSSNNDTIIVNNNGAEFRTQTCPMGCSPHT